MRISWHFWKLKESKSVVLKNCHLDRIEGETICCGFYNFYVAKQDIEIKSESAENGDARL